MSELKTKKLQDTPQVSTPGLWDHEQLFDNTSHQGESLPQNAKDKERIGLLAVITFSCRRANIRIHKPVITLLGDPPYPELSSISCSFE